MRKSLLIVVVLILALSISAVAQNISGEIRGVVSDQSGAVVSGATVTATDASTNLLRTAQTSGSGVYAITDLPPGKYRVTIKGSGFKEAVVNNVIVNAASVATVNSSLAVGTAGETVT